MLRPSITVEGARQNNLKGITVRVPVGAVTAITGVAGSGKSSLAFDTLYAEGYRRYVETFSPYARQFLERLDRPKAERIEGVLPSIAIDQTAPVRTSRSTIGTMTSVADYLRALFARCAVLHCRGCGQPVERASPSSIFESLVAGRADGQVHALLCFEVQVGKARPAALRELFAQSGFRRILESGKAVRLEEATLQSESGKLTVVLDRVLLQRSRRQRIIDSLETALRFGKGTVELRVAGEREPRRFSEQLRCARCGIDYSEPTSALFSFNNPVGACETCKGFGRTIDIDPDLVIPDGRLSIAEGCIRPFQTPSYLESQQDLLAFFERRGLRADLPWRELDAETRDLVWKGEPGGRQNYQTRWYGIEGFFRWLEGRTYRMHVRVFLSRFRRYLPCASCHGERLKPDALLFRLGGRTLPELESMQIAEAARHLDLWQPPRGDTAAQLLVSEIRGRLRFLLDTGLGYLTLGRQSRTLSGGEAQRVTLATALGSSLTNTLYVLDEPSIGLHPRDAGRLAGVLRRLADAGNAVVVVEHDPALIRAADHVIDLGPGPGRAGGEVVYQGPLDGLLEAPGSLTGDFLAGRLRVPERPSTRSKVRAGEALRVVGARENNLKDVTVAFPLHELVCITGVSGSGKSTLLDQVLYRNLRRLMGQSESEPGACGDIEGFERVGGVVLVDQSPLGRSSRANAATYIGALDPLRDAFAKTEEARARGLKASAFSFNSKAGACPVCEGAGFEKVELQFLPDAFVRCAACDGRRYRPEVLEVRCRGFSIAELLDLPASEVARVFADNPKVVRALQPLIDIGLGYLSLSQPAATLSGGEAQRLKLAAYLAEASRLENQLFILDEPTTGLHAADVSVLIGALRQLVAAGHSVLVIEHNLEVAAAADWIVNLGPEGGDAGGRVVGEGPPETIARLDTATGQALKGALAGKSNPRSKGKPARSSAASLPAPTAIRILGATEHNLQHVHVDVPRDRLVAVTGVSGSGKSTLAFDVLYAEGQRRFLDCLPAYARQFIRPLARPEVDRVEGMPPTVALEQKLSRGTPLSTAGTSSEVYHYLRLLYAFLGVAHCPQCGVAGEATAAPDLARRIAEHFPKAALQLLAPLVRQRKGLHRELIETAGKRGIERVRVDGTFHFTSKPPKLDRYQIHDVEAVVARVEPGPRRHERLTEAVSRALELGNGTVIASPVSGKASERLYSTRRACPRCGAGLPVPDPRLFTFSQRFGACPACEGFGTDPTTREEHPETCEVCAGTRLRPEALAVRIDGRSIGELAAMPVRQLRGWLDRLLKSSLPPEVLERVAPELRVRLELIDRLGLGYLTLDRGTDTLSTGEGQRIRIVAALASNLQGVCYVLDEPTVGLHPRDSAALTGALSGLRDRGNTVVVVEHDESLIRVADHVIDLGPGAGPHGGRIVGEGTPQAVAESPESLTGLWLAGGGAHPPWPRRSLEDCPRVRIQGARLHNLRGIDVDFPLGRFVAVTGVSGSGKSTLVRDVLYQALTAELGDHERPPVLKRLSGAKQVSRVLEVDESPIGRTPRSVPATYVGIMDFIRQLFAGTPDAKARGYGAGRFSFNVAGGRCERCEGQGRLRVSMPLLPEVYIPCESCAGRRYNADTLEVGLKGKSISEVLSMTVEEAKTFFEAFTAVRRPLEFLGEIGLEYLQLGQPSPTLSGGEAQRIKLAAELASRGAGHSFFVLDEPTTGLHMADVAKLVGALQRLVDRGDTVVVIEHNQDLIASADCVIDLGPEGGDEGGRVVAWGTPEQVARSKTSRTARYLTQALKRRAQG